MEELTKEIADKYMEFKGEVRGVSLKNYGEFILDKEGPSGLQKLEDELAGLGHPIKFLDLITMNFYPLGLQALTITAMQKIFNYDNKNFYELGTMQPKVSLIMKLFMGYFLSVQRVAKEVPNIWGKSYSVGKLEVMELNEKKRHMVLRLSDFPCHPMQCHETLRGYFPTVLRFVTKSQTTCEETKCVFRGDPYHQYILRW